jgi:17beta-estradiol 17-dehydrogenase / very-long-chain 3-oxoacyl-CoA reductase
LKNINPQIQTRTIVADFGDCQREGFFDRIMEQLRDIDIGILINNVGISNIGRLTTNIGYLHEISQQGLLKEINVNCVPMTMLTSLVVQKMLKREPRGAIINLSSIAGVNPCPYISTYSATKAYNDFFSKAVGMEYSGNINLTQIKLMFYPYGL